MIHKGFEILARTHVSGNRQWSLTEDGKLDEPVFDMLHDDDTIVWYEVADFNVDGVQFETIEDAKKYIDDNIEE